ncbi:hypothetical protein GCM10012275_04400 [Longimycelium tulufanense]|uniref:Uncharacterized protein n=1 Tax=Longimycelium tulufanense TaxID=907463 RepID=A0A8J3C5Z9_9PSEU|nr:hypothetical protein [Longimycelium tulufanense]GGM36277.1 hypothetical protein GCM10012275_04400 [Longimycelium tulufanense]
MGLAEVPLPRGQAALAEAVLLGRALLGAEPQFLEQNILVREAWEAAGLPDRDVTVRMITKGLGPGAKKHYICLDEHGAGRHHDDSYRPPGRVRTLRVRLGRTPARDRFLSLNRHLAEQLLEAEAIEATGGPPPHPVALRRGRFVANAAHAIDHCVLDEPHPELRELSDQFRRTALLSPEGVPLSAAEGLEGEANGRRDEGRLGSTAAAALLVVARLPSAIAAAGQAQRVEFTRFFSFGMLELGVSPGQAIYGLCGKALREGHAEVVFRAAEDLLREAERRRDTALDGPPDRDAFGELLFAAAPYALAALLLASAAADEGSSAELAVQATAEELFVRLQDGLVHQWADLGDVRLREERRQIREAQQRGDTLTVNLIVREGELGLHRPRAVRDLLLGKMPWPNAEEGA